MTVRTKSDLQAIFVAGARPTQQNFTDLIDSYIDTSAGGVFGLTMLATDSAASAASLLANEVGEAITASGANSIISKVTTGSFTPSGVVNLSASTLTLANNQVVGSAVNVDSAFASRIASAFSSGGIDGSKISGTLSDVDFNATAAANALSAASDLSWYNSVPTRFVIGGMESTTKLVGSISTSSATPVETAVSATYTPLFANSRLEIAAHSRYWGTRLGNNSYFQIYDETNATARATWDIRGIATTAGSQTIGTLCAIISAESATSRTYALRYYNEGGGKAIIGAAANSPAYLSIKELKG